MQIGSLVIRKDGAQLRSGAEAYQGAVLVSIEPFILISEGLDMVWRSLSINDFKSYNELILTKEEVKPYLEKIGLIK